MRNIIPLLIGGSLIVLGACSKSDTQAGENHEPGMQMQMAAGKAHAMVQVPTIQCGICKKTIETGVVKTAGILSVNVDVEQKMAHINYDGNQLSLKDIEQAISKLGYQANDTPADPEAYADLLDCCKVPE